MKKYTAIVFLMLFSTGIALGQTRADIFDPNVPVTWLGNDFTRAKIVGDRERLSTESDVVKLMTAINDLMIKEADKYNVHRALKRKTGEMDMSVTTDHNLALDINAMFTPATPDELNVTPGDIQAIIDDYDFKTHTGLGVMVNYILLNKTDEQGIVFFTVVNMDNKEVLLTEKYMMKPGGASIRNFWARLVVDMLDKIQSKDFEAWRKKSSY